MENTVSDAESLLHPRRILAVFNPVAGGNHRERFDRIVAALKAEGCAVTVRETEYAGHGEEIVRALAPDAFDVVAACGGDGTINEVVNGLRGKDMVLGIMPLGTANVLADEIGLSKSPAVVARSLARGPIKPMRVGLANGRRFTMMAGVGFDANVVSRVSAGLKKALGPLAYVWRSATQAFADPFAPCDVTIDGVGHTSISAVVCNGRRYGGPFIAAPAANIADDSFQIVLMKGRGWFSVMRYGAALIAGQVAIWPDVEVITGRDVVLNGVTGQPVQADGDIIAALPLHITVDPEPVRLVYPS